MWKRRAKPGTHFGFQLAHVAQLVEHVLGKDEVTGSNPVMGSAAMKPRAGTSTAGSNPANPRGRTPEQGE